MATLFMNGHISTRYYFGHLASNDDQIPYILKGQLLCKHLSSVSHLEIAASKAALEIFNANWVEMRPLSGVHATMATIASLTKTQDIIYSISPEKGGHFATKGIVENFGRISKYLPYDDTIHPIDLNALINIIKVEKIRMVFLDCSIPLYAIPISNLRKILGEETLLVYDASHTLGLIGDGKFQSPLTEGCDILQGNTHKSFPGAQKGIILFKEKSLGQSFSEIIGNSFVSTQHTHHSIANYITILEMKEFGIQYANQMLKNKIRLKNNLKKNGFNVIEDDNSTHIIAIENSFNQSAYELGKILIRCGIDVNARMYHQKPIVRIGLQEVTRRGMKESDMDEIADLFLNSLNSSKVYETIEKVKILMEKHSDIDFSFDYLL